MNIERFTQALSDILSEKYGVEIKITAERKENVREEIVLRNNPCECQV